MDSSYLSQRSPDGRYVGPPGVPFPPAGSAAEFVLHPYDQVQIRRQPEFEMPQSVFITGEVSVPGQYTAVRMLIAKQILAGAAGKCTRALVSQGKGCLFDTSSDLVEKLKHLAALIGNQCIRRHIDLKHQGK